MIRRLITVFLFFVMVLSNAFAGQDTPELWVPQQVIQVYVILQNPGEPVDGSSETLDLVSREKFIADFERFKNIARQKRVKLIITAVTEDEQWIQNQIKYKGKNLRRALYRDPHASVTYSGAEVPLDQCDFTVDRTSMNEKETLVNRLSREYDDFCNIIRTNRKKAVVIATLIIGGIVYKFSDIALTPVHQRLEQDITKHNLPPRSYPTQNIELSKGVSFKKLLSSEINNKNLLKNINDAERLDLENTSGQESALRLYRGVLDQLSPAALKALDQPLLSSANIDFYAGRNPDAVAKYKELFSGYRQVWSLSQWELEKGTTKNEEHPSFVHQALYSQ